ncbi:MAG: O-antigen polysaccharide polymerase Wzy [Syntrophobacteraceae bacterium]
MGKQRIVSSFPSILLFMLGILSLSFCFSEETLSVNMSAALAASIWIAGITCLALRAENGLFSLPVGYLLVLGVFHLGMIIPLLMGFRVDLANPWPLSPSVSKSLSLCGTAFAFYSTAALSYKYRSGEARQLIMSHRFLGINPNISVHFLLIGGLILGVVGACFLGIGISNLNLFQVSYGDSYMARMDADPRLFGTGYLFVLMGMVISGAAASQRQIKWIAMISILVFAPLFLYGFRGHLIVYFMALLSIWHRKDPRLARKVGYIALIAVVLLAPAVRALRDSREITFADAIKNTNPLDFITEAGGSLRPLFETVNEIDYYKNPYWYGASYLTGITRIIPNLRIDWERPNSLDTVAPSAWIMERVDPYLFAMGGGIGFSGIAEPFLNFGPFGVVLFFGLAGYLLMKYERASNSRINPYYFAVLMCAYASLLWTCRNDFLEFFRPTAWAFVFVTGISFVVRHWPTLTCGNTKGANGARALCLSNNEGTGT